MFFDHSALHLHQRADTSDQHVLHVLSMSSTDGSWERMLCRSSDDKAMIAAPVNGYIPVACRVFRA